MSKLWLTCIVVIALGIRLLNAIFIPWQGGDLVVSDMQGYDRAAVALLEQSPLGVHTAEEYIFHPLGSDTYHPPGYYFFLAGIYGLLGHRYIAVRVIQGFLGTVTCLLIYLIGKEVFGETAGLLAATFSAVYPPLIFYTGVLLTESLGTFLLASATWLLLRWSRIEPTRRHALLWIAGLVLGLAALTRTVLLTAAPIGLLWVLLIAGRWPGWRRAVHYGLALCLPIALVITPITMRNYQIHGEFVLISTNGGVNFFLGHGGNPRLKDRIRNIPEDYEPGDPLIGISSRTATQEEAYFYQLGWQYVRQHPLRALRALPAQFRSMYWDSHYWPAASTQAHFMRMADRILWKLLILPLGLLGLLVIGRQQLRRAALLYAVVLCSAFIPLIFWAQTRFRVPFVPYFVILAAGTTHELWRRLRYRRPSQQLAGQAM